MQQACPEVSLDEDIGVGGPIGHAVISDAV